MDYRYRSSTNKDDFEHLREDLPTIMAFAGWTIEKLSGLLGVSKTTITYIKNEKGRMTAMYYLSICKLIDDEIEINCNRALQEAINILNGVGGHLISRDDLINHVELEKRRIGTKLQEAKLQDELCQWIFNM